jgi:2-keto-4-pentenoate hydratase/2-oxohepta-3-ene-1,7-dioic acid hydratase in catechol pathway
MRIIGVRRAGAGTEIARLAPGGDSVTVLAALREFWSQPRRYLDQDMPGVVVPRSGVQVVPPVLPDARVICIGLNYLEHVAEGSYRDAGVPEFPTLFARWPSTLTVSGTEIPVPASEDGLDWEGEIAAWVGDTLIDADPEAALSAVVGYSAFNDLTARRAQKLTTQWTLGKNADRSGPIGPLVPASEVRDLREGLRVTTRVNGTVVQDGCSSDMVYDVGGTLSLISRTFTLRPGDVLATGTPSGVGYSRVPPWLLKPGDVVEVSVDQLGTITNPIVPNGARHNPAMTAR